jgi:hypothetical protein
MTNTRITRVTQRSGSEQKEDIITDVSSFYSFHSIFRSLSAVEKTSADSNCHRPLISLYIIIEIPIERQLQNDSVTHLFLFRY